MNWKEIVMPGYSPNAPTRKLPERPNLEQLRKQAKDLLDQYRSHVAAAVEEVERFERQPDTTTFSLHDAQRVLARAYGYESWTKLKTFVDGANVQELVASVQRGDVSRTRVLLSARPELIGMDISASNEHRALHFAVLRRDPAMVRILMEAGADARKGIYPHRDATSALALATEREYHEIVEIIEDEERERREEMSCPNATISPVQDEINGAIRRRDTARAIQLLTDDGSLIHACDRQGGTPLHVAAEAGNAELVAWLVDRRANVRKRDLQDLTPLDRAALAANPWRNDPASIFPSIARLLLDRGAGLTLRAAVALGKEAEVCNSIQKDREQLHHYTRKGGLVTLAVNHGQLEMVRLLLDLGADVDERTKLEELEEPTMSWGQPLWCAALANRYEISELLLDRGADPNSNVYASGWPLGNAWNHPDGRIKRLLLARGAKRQPYMIAEAHDVSEAERLLAADPSEELAQELAWSAADQGCPEIVELALSKLSWTPGDSRWHWILIQPIRGASGTHSENEGHFASLDVLLKHGVDPNVSRYGQTVLHFAAAYSGPVTDTDRAQFASMLLAYGARLGMRDELLKSTPLGWACRWGRIELTKTLIAHGAPVDEPDAEAWSTPKAWAVKMKRDEIARLLSNSLHGNLL
jgi:ankyrin repeat protein